MFLQIHYLTSYHASLLNRDDAGLAKRIPFGGVQRLRVSSQCQKRHWRQWLMNRLDLPTGVRSRQFFSRQVKQRLVEQGLDEDMAHGLVLALAKGLLTSSGDKDALDKETLEMKQPVLFGRPEADFFVKLTTDAASGRDLKEAKAYLKDVLKKNKKNFKALMDQAGAANPVAGVEGAMFGRFVTSDILARVDAPVHVAHAFTTHALDTEVDFFTVVDDLAMEEETGAGHIGDMELGAGVFYGYVVVDVPLLVSNLTGCDRKEWKRQDLEALQSVLSQLIRAIAEISPGAKLGATAPYSRAEFVLLETGTSQPRSLANAFLKPVNLNVREHPMQQSIQAISDYIDALEGMYGNTGERRFLSTIHQWPKSQEEKMPLADAIEKGIKYLVGDGRTVSNEG